MKEFNYVIVGGGCAGLSLAYELDLYEKLENKTLAIVEPRAEYKRDKTWSFWKVIPHNFEDCVKKSWKEFSIKTSSSSKIIKCDKFPYQSIDSGLFYEKINNKLAKNKENDFIYTGCQILNKNLFKKFEVSNFPISDIWNSLLKENKLYGYENKNNFYHLTNLKIYNELLKNQ